MTVTAGKSAKDITKLLWAALKKSRPFIFEAGGEKVMIKAKVGGIILGGLAGYLILNKGLNTVSRCVQNVCSASKWKNYYKYGKDKNMDPPERYVQYVSSNKTCQDSSKETDNTANNGEKKDASKKPFGTILAEAVVNAINDTFDLGKAPEGAFKGQTEASGEDCDANAKAEDLSQEDDDPEHMEKDVSESESQADKVEEE